MFDFWKLAGCLMKTKTDTIIPVVLRTWQKYPSKGEVFALLPTLPSDQSGYCCGSFDLTEGHGGAYYAFCIQSSRPATKAESAPLIQELKRIGYCLRVVKRASAAMHNERIKNGIIHGS